MDESHRLKGMPENYDQQLFKSLYDDTKLLIKKLAYEIDGRKFGIDNDELQSWFYVKFLYAFNKYYGDPKIKGYIINALRTYKQRIILNSYQPQYILHQSSIDITEVWEDIGPSEELDTSANELLASAKEYMKENLSEDAYFILEIELNPPPYILTKLRNSEQKKMPKLPTELIADYLDIPDEEGLEYLDSLRYEIKEVTQKAKEYFNLNPIRLSA